MMIGDKVINYLKNRKGNYGLYYYNLLSGEEVKYNANKTFPAASIIKIPILCEFFKEVEEGKIKRDELIPINMDDKVGGAGILHELRDGIKMRLDELALLMITLSDNNATNIIIDKLTMDNINSFLANRDCSTRLQRKMMDFKARKNGKENLTNALEIGSILKDIYERKIDGISNKHCEEIISIMSKQIIRDKISFYIPEDDWSKVASKTGTLDKVEHDASIFDFSEQKFILVILSKDLPTNAYGNITIAKTAKMIYDNL